MLTGPEARSCPKRQWPRSKSQPDRSQIDLDASRTVHKLRPRSASDSRSVQISLDECCCERLRRRTVITFPCARQSEESEENYGVVQKSRWTTESKSVKINISRGSVATHSRCGGIFNTDFIVTVKNSENRSELGESTGKSIAPSC